MNNAEIVDEIALKIYHENFDTFVKLQKEIGKKIAEEMKNHNLPLWKESSDGIRHYSSELRLLLFAICDLLKPNSCLWMSDEFYKEENFEKPNTGVFFT